MLDKIVLTNKNQAYFIFDNRTPFCIHSDINVIPLLMWFIGHSNAHLITNNKGEPCIEFRRDDNEVTQEIIITEEDVA